jgi:hypothetical protein
VTLFVLVTLVVVGCVVGVVVVLVRRRKQKEKVEEIIRHMMERRETLRLVEAEASKSNQIKSHLIMYKHKSMRFRSMRLTLSRVQHLTFSQAVRAMLNLPCLQHSLQMA